MSHNSGEATASEGRKKGRWFFSPWIIGGIAGEFFWGLAILGAYFFEAFASSFPRWFLDLDLADILGSICAVIAAPIAIGGWLFIWGDGPQPPAWVKSIVFNVAFAVCFYGAVGALAGRFVAGISYRQQQRGGKRRWRDG
jgi:hypothetical protein